MAVAESMAVIPSDLASNFGDENMNEPQPVNDAGVHIAQPAPLIDVPRCDEKTIVSLKKFKLWIRGVISKYYFTFTESAG